MSPIEWAVRRPIAVSVLTLGAGLFGLLALRYLPVDLFPHVEAPVISVITRYPGASAEDVEHKITEILEEAMGDVPDLERIESISKENVSILGLRFAYGTDLNVAANRVRENVEFAKSYLPEEADNPVLFHFSTDRFPTVMLAITSSGGDPFLNRKIIEDRILDPLRRIPDVGAVQVWNAPERQVLVEADAQRLAAYGLTLEHLAAALRREGVAAPAGTLDVGPMEFPVRLQADYATLDDVARVVVVRRPDGSTVRVGDVAEVRRGLEELDEQAEADGHPALWVGVMKESGANTVAVARRVRAELSRIRAELPPTLRVTLLTDASQFILRTLDNLTSTALLGGVVVVLVVLAFLRRWRASLVVALAIPTSSLAAFLLMYLFGYTLNTMSLLAVAIAMGMVVDNAIVVLENVGRHVEEGMEQKRAAATGAREVAAAVTASTATTLVIFAPLIFVAGLVGVLFRQLALVLAGTLTASLVVALTLIPSYCGLVLSPREVAGGTAGGRWMGWVRHRYDGVLRAGLRRPWFVVGVCLGLAVATAAMLPVIGFDFMPQQDSSEIRFRVELPVGTSVEESMRVGRKLAALARSLPEVEVVSYKAGTARVAWASALGGREGANIVAGMMRLVPLAERTRRDKEIAEELRLRFSAFPEITALSIETGDMFSRVVGGLGRPLTVEVYGDDYEQMMRAAERIREIVLDTPGTRDPDAALFEFRPELRFRLDRDRAARLGVSAASVARALRASLHGEVVTQIRPGGDEIDLVLRLRAPDRRQPADLERVRVPAATGAVVELRELGEFLEEPGVVEIRRKNKQRMVTVGAGVEGRSLGDVAREVERRIAAADLPPGIRTRLGGEVAEQRGAFRDLTLLLGLGAVLVYLVLAAQYESLVEPFVVMFAVPFSFTGAFLALLLTRTSLSVPAFLGLVMLIGIVVNNAIVFVDYANQLRSRGLSLEAALRLAGRRRLRPILMTTVTTVCGALPLALGRGEGAEFWAPLGRTVVGGLSFSTVVTLVLVPVVYALLEPVRRKSPAGKTPLAAVRPVPEPETAAADAPAVRRAAP